MIIRKLQPDEPFPMELLLLADESLELVEEYIQRGQCFVAEADQLIIGRCAAANKAGNSGACEYSG